MDEIEDAIGGYLYVRSKSQWSKINDVIRDGEESEIRFDTHRVNYESVPHDTRERAYESFREIESDPEAPDKDYLIIGYDNAE